MSKSAVCEAKEDNNKEGKSTAILTNEEAQSNEILNDSDETTLNVSVLMV